MSRWLPPRADIRLVTTTDAVVDIVPVVEGSGAKGLWEKELSGRSECRGLDLW